jgi:hypothetical protein
MHQRTVAQEEVNIPIQKMIVEEKHVVNTTSSACEEFA